jgi:hypothetical protein
MLNDWNRSSTVPTRGIVAGVTDTGDEPNETGEPANAATAAPIENLRRVFLFIGALLPFPDLV